MMCLSLSSFNEKSIALLLVSMETVERLREYSSNLSRTFVRKAFLKVKVK